jgi:hypothetical protein
MTSDIAQDSLPTNSKLIGSFFTGTAGRTSQQGHCLVCNEELLPQSKFCGDCGTPTKQDTATNAADPVSEHTVPDFAQVNPKMSRAIPPELKKEHRKLTTLLARERFFLLTHYLIFLATNLFGFWMAMKAYNGLFYADQISRTVMALFPMFFINTVALGCLAPIKGTKNEISRLKEKLTYLHYRIEYVGL